MLACGDGADCAGLLFSAVVVAGTSEAVDAGCWTGDWLLLAATSDGDGDGATGSGVTAACCCGWAGLGSAAGEVLRTGLIEAVLMVLFTGAGAGELSLAGAIASC